MGASDTSHVVTLDSLREMDIELMRRLSPRVNVIPVVGRADSLTLSELKAFKKRVSDHFLLIRDSRSY
jgi:septin family protein